VPIRPTAFPLRIAAPFLAAGLVTAGSALSAAVADPVCSATPVSVEGEPASFEWLARSKARANWRASVRAMSTLGPDYANWNIAIERTEACAPGASGIACRFTGTPCKR
jgi:hypothetical protein